MSQSRRGIRPRRGRAIRSAFCAGRNNEIETINTAINLSDKFSGVSIADATCTFTPGQSNPLALGEAILATSSLQVNEQVCNDDLRQTWEALQMRGQSSAAPADFTTFAAQYVAAKVAEGVEHNIWAGNWKQILDEDVPYSSFTGIIQNIQAGAPARETVTARGSG